MNVFRTLLVWLMVLSLPVEGMASTAMAHCKDLKTSAAGSSAAMPNGHDHAAMMAMAAMDDAGSAAQTHHALPSRDAGVAKGGEASKVGCQCGCKCSGDCAVSCVGLMILLTHAGFAAAATDVALSVAMPQGQAHAAYLYDPLRPPSAVAL